MYPLTFLLEPIAMMATLKWRLRFDVFSPLCGKIYKAMSTASHINSNNDYMLSYLCDWKFVTKSL